MAFGGHGRSSLGPALVIANLLRIPPAPIKDGHVVLWPRPGLIVPSVSPR